ncbi:hypothetical protein D3C81_2002280 [compost metagenome]
MHHLHPALYLADPVYRTSPAGLNPIQIELKTERISVAFLQQHLDACYSVYALKFKIMIMIYELQAMLFLQGAGNF